MLNSPPINILSFKLFKVLKAVKNLDKKLHFIDFRKIIFHCYNVFITKELSQKLLFSNPYIFTTQ